MANTAITALSAILGSAVDAAADVLPIVDVSVPGAAGNKKILVSQLFAVPSQTLVTPILGVAAATSVNKVTLTAPATSAVLTIADGKTFTNSNTLTLTATDGSTLAIGTGGTLGTSAYTATGALGAANLIGTGTANRLGTATTNDALADTMLSASATTQKALVIQMKATPTASPFVVQTSAGVACVSVQSDGGLIVDQRTGATFSNLLDVKFQGTTLFNVTGTSGGTALAVSAGGFNAAGGFFTVAATTGNVASLGTIAGNHYLGNGTSPTVAGNGSSNGSIAGKDAFCKVTVGTGTTTSIVITFGTAYATAPVCVVNAQTTTTPINVVTSTTTATLTTTLFTAGEVLQVMTGGF